MTCTSLLYFLLGIVSGIVSGFMGIGGGLILIPCLVFIFGYTQQYAQGTTLAILVPPIGILAAWKYYQNGNVNIQAAIFIALGFLAGSLVGANFANYISNRALSLTFGTLLMVVGTYIVWENLTNQ